MKRILPNARWLLAMLILIYSSAQSQVKPPVTKVSGQITDQAGLTIPGVTVRAKNGNVTAVSDVNGKYQITLTPSDEALIFSYVGYKNQEVAVRGRTVIDIVLQQQATDLNQVVVIGYGQSARKDLTGAIGSVDMKDALKAPVQSFEESLAGRVAGVQVTSLEGKPGTSSNIVIRGNNSLTGSNAPLYVIDGFPIENPNDNTINPSDIASIDVLKDASATAIYGARGSNGVIIITTKKGKKGAPEINYNGYYGMQRNLKTMDLLTPYEFVKLELEKNPLNGPAIYLINGKTSAEDYQNVPGIDWQSQIFRSAPMQSHDVAVRGGNDQTTYAISGSGVNQQGVILNSGYNRYQGRIVLDQKLSKSITTGVNVNYAQTKISGTSPSQSATTSSSANILANVWAYRPIGNSLLSSDQLLDLPFDTGVDISQDYRYNPILTAKNELDVTNSTNFSTNVYLLMNLLKNKLTVRLSGGLIRAVDRRDVFYNSHTRYGDPSTTQGKANGGPNGQLTNYQRDNLISENTVTYKDVINAVHSFSILAGVTAQRDGYNSFGLKATAVPNEVLGVSGLDEGTPYSIASASSKNTLLSFLSRFNYSYKSRYLVTMSFRADGSSKFSPENRWAYFPSAALSWRISDESFLKPVTAVNDAKLRISYGATGNNRIGSNDFAYLSTLSFPTGDYYSYGNIYQQGASPSVLGNKNLKWETTNQFDAGLDLTLLSNRINFTFDYYNKVTSNLLLNASLPSSSGYLNGLKNIGKVSNYGLEFSLATKNITGKTFAWGSAFNIAFNRNKVLALNDNQTSLESNVSWENNYNSVPLYTSRVGQPMGLLYGYKWVGNYQYADFDKSSTGVYTLKSNVPDNGAGRTVVQPGDIKYEDVNGDGTVNALDRVVIGNPNPKFVGGFTNNFAYKNFDLNVFLQWSYGNSIYNTNRIVFEGFYSQADWNQYATYANHWTPTNPNNDYFRVNGQGPVAYSSRVVEDGSFLRLKTVSLGYSPKLGVKAIKNLRLYLSGQNLYTWTKYSGMDPEVSTRNSALTPGFDFSAYPRARTIVFGVNVTL